MAIGDKLVTLNALKTVHDADNISSVKRAIQQKITEPQTEGTSGQVLTTNGNGGRSWTTVQGGSSDIEIKNSTTTGIDLDVSDNNGNVIARFQDGGIETAKFHGFEYITFSKPGTTNNRSLTITINQSFKQNDRIVLHVERFDYPYNAPWNTGIACSYYEDDRPIVEDSKVDVGYLEHRITEDTSSVSVVYNGTLPTGTQTATFVVSLLGDIPVKPTVIKVKQDGTGDYTTLRAALDAIGIQANHLTNPYRVELYPGTYNVFDDYTDEEILATTVPMNDNSFVGPKLLNGVSLIGIGQPHEIILYGELDTTKFNSDIRAQLSTLNIQGSNTIENLTIIGKNTRYAVHDDFGSPQGIYTNRVVRNCIFRGYNVAYDPHHTYGAGMPDGGMSILYENCDFGEIAGHHTAPNIPCSVSIHYVNCTGQGVAVGDYQTAADVDVVGDFRMDGCDFGFVSVTVSDTTPHLRITGSGNKPALVCAPTSVRYDFYGVVPVPLTRLNINVGDLVERYQTGSSEHGPLYRAATALDTACGVAVYKDDTDVYIQLSGYVRTDRVGLTTFSANDYVGYSSGRMAVVQSEASAFGRVKYIDANGNGYIELRWR